MRAGWRYAASFLRTGTRPASSAGQAFARKHSRGHSCFDRGDGPGGFVYKTGMAARKIDEVIERVRHWSKERQQDAAEVLLEMERQDASGYRLTDAQAEEVARIQREFREGRGTFASDEEMAALWKSCGL